MSMLARRGLLGAAASSLALPALVGTAHAAFPAQPVRIIVPWNAGGLVDVLVRILGPSMSATLGQPVVVENRAGANGAVGTQAVARSPADGHTLIAANAETHAINPLIYPRLPYDPARDFQPVTLFARGPLALITRPGLGAENLQGFLDLVRRQPGKVTYASWGIGSTSHLAMERLTRLARLEMLHVPFTGAAPASTALVGGQVDAMFLNAGPAEALARDGRPKVLAVGSRERMDILPAAPTLVEQGLDMEGANWFGLLAPARTPAAAAQRVAEVVAEGLGNAATKESFRLQGAIPTTSAPDEMGRFIAEDRERWDAVVKDLNIRLD